MALAQALTAAGENGESLGYMVQMLTCRHQLVSPDRDKGKVFDSKRMPAHSSVSKPKNMEPNEIKKDGPAGGDRRTAEREQMRNQPMLWALRKSTAMVISALGLSPTSRSIVRNPS